VAVVAIIAAGDMRGMLAGRDDAVMTGAAGTDDLGMVDRVSRGPDVRRVAVFADVAGLDVIWRLAGRVRAVMAAKAVASDVDVIEIRR